jgi:hypothetical protein
MPNPDTFGTVVNCIDGRAQNPASDWIKLYCGVDFVDTITTPGADRALAEGPPERVSRVEIKVRLSVVRHSSPVVAIAGHYDCLANPCDIEERFGLIARSAETILSWGLDVRVLGLYVNEWGSVEVVTDTGRDRAAPRSFL